MTLVIPLKEGQNGHGIGSSRAWRGQDESSKCRGTTPLFLVATCVYYDGVGIAVWLEDQCGRVEQIQGRWECW